MQDSHTLSEKVNKYYNDFNAKGGIEEQKSYLYDLINYKIDEVDKKVSGLKIFIISLGYQYWF